MREHEEILLGGMFRPSEQNCPTREGELIESIDKIYDIPNPRVGMRVYVENTGKEYVIKSLKEKTIGGVTVPDAVVGTLEETVSGEVLDNVASEFANQLSNLANQFSNIERNIKANAAHYNKIGFNVYEDKVQLYAKNISDNDVRVDDIPAATNKKAGVMSAEDKRKLDAAGNGATEIAWDASSNMNDFKTPGVYDIYGERTRQDDNLPILNASSGHSIAARLTVVASTLQPANNEICITQFLMLSNRKGGDGNMYVRTYNENNSPAADWWTPWKKIQGAEEWGIVTDSDSWPPSSSSGAPMGSGMNFMIDNGVYTGVYTDNNYFNGTPSFIETFTLIVINNYAVAGMDSRLKRTISQLKYAVDAITNQATVKQRTKTDGSDWTDWKEIGGGGSSEVDITDAVKQYGLPALVQQGYVKEGVVYKVECWATYIPQLDTANKIKSSISYSNLDDKTILKIQIQDSGRTVFIDCYIVGFTGKYYKYIISQLGTENEMVCVSADMTTL